MSSEIVKAEVADGNDSPRLGGLTVLTWTPNPGDRVDPGWVDAVRSKLDAPVYSLAVPGSGLISLGASREDLEGALSAIRRKHPESAVLLLRAGVELPEPLSALERLLDAGQLPDITVFPGNYADLFNPFSAWPDKIAPENPARMLYWCASARWQWVDSASRDCVLLAPGIAADGAERIGGVPYALFDQVFAVDPARPLLPRPEPDRDSSTLQLGELRLRLRHLALSGASPAAGAEPGLPVTLHIAHNWGGGVWRWIEDFIAGDSRGVNLVLIADGDRSGEFCGRGLKLFVGGIGHGLIREIPLAPRIVSTVAHHSQYRSVLTGLIERYGVGRIIVSSLIGHSLDCVETGLPTIQVLHDFYPVWPLLDFDPLPFVDKKGGLRRSRALARHGDTLRMRPRDAAFWNRIAAAWRRSIGNHDVRLVAPAEHVIERWKALNPGSALEIRKIPHAFRPFADRKKPSPPGLDERLHLVIPGRLTRGKGLELLEQALPEIAPRVRLTALGCGREAFRLFGRSNIDLVINYQHAEFPALIRKLRPHAALFLSTVPETWNYALSEVRALGLVPIATRTGSFPERIKDGKNGLLFDPDAESLVRMISALVEQPERLADLNPGKLRQQTPAQLVSRFDRFLPVELRFGVSPSFTESRVSTLDKIAGDLAQLETDHARLEAECERLDAEIANRTRWAEKLERQFQERSKWAESLQADLESSRDALARLREEFENRTEWSRSLDRELVSARESRAKLQKEFDERTKWSKKLDADLAKARKAYAKLQGELEDRTKWSKKLGRELESARSAYADLQQQLEERSEWALALDADLAKARESRAKLQKEFEERTEWALQLDREKKELETIVREEIDRTRVELEHERQSRRIAESELETALQHVAQRDERLIELQGRLDQRDSQIEEFQQRLEHIETEFNSVVASRSWRITRPLRVCARLVRNALRRGALNPLRWPRLIGRFFHYWKLLGLRRTLESLQSPKITVAEHVSVSPQTVPEPGRIAEPIALGPVEQPRVSIIVPVYNQLHFTSACLQSLVSVRNRVDFEIIVVDDCSTDETRAWLKLCRGIRYLRNRRNKGFIRTCNRGARAARGRWVVFLNNDTRVTDDWLDELVETFNEHPLAGVVGARLVFADGTLQEAGGIVFRDASGWNYGRDDDPDRPDYTFLSEADYVSGACLAIERELFLELDGFDEYYVPAYYEDTDLCFRIRERGLKVLYQPASTVVHFEGGTSGTDESAGEKKHQVINRGKFLERWHEVLDKHPENPHEYSRQVARNFRYRRYSRRALVIDATTPMPDHDSGSVRMFALLRLLDELGYQTSFLPENRLWAGRHSRDLQKAGIEVLTAPWVQDPEAWLSEHGAALDLIIVSRHYVLSPMLKMLRAMCPQARLIFDTVDLHFLREQREAEISGVEADLATARKTQKQELELIKASDATLVVSQFEQELLQSMMPEANVSVVSNIHTLRDPGKPFEQRHDLVFVGGFQHPPNLDSAKWLIDEIMPLVLDELPDVTLHIIGSRMPESLKRWQAPGVKLHGFVSDIDAYMTGCRISVAPLRYGAGVKGKVNQSMSHGLPVVATSCAAEGMYARHGVDILMADDAHGLAAEIIRLYRDRELWESLAKNGRGNVERHFSVTAARRAILETLQGVGLDFSAAGARR